MMTKSHAERLGHDEDDEFYQREDDAELARSRERVKRLVRMKAFVSTYEPPCPTPDPFQPFSPSHRHDLDVDGDTWERSRTSMGSWAGGGGDWSSASDEEVEQAPLLRDRLGRLSIPPGRSSEGGWESGRRSSPLVRGWESGRKSPLRRHAPLVQAGPRTRTFPHGGEGGWGRKGLAAQGGSRGEDGGRVSSPSSLVSSGASEPTLPGDWCREGGGMRQKLGGLLSPPLGDGVLGVGHDFSLMSVGKDLSLLTAGRDSIMSAGSSVYPSPLPRRRALGEASSPVMAPGENWSASTSPLPARRVLGQLSSPEVMVAGNFSREGGSPMARMGTPEMFEKPREESLAAAMGSPDQRVSSQADVGGTLTDSSASPKGQADARGTLTDSSASPKVQARRAISRAAAVYEGTPKGRRFSEAADSLINDVMLSQVTSASPPVAREGFDPESLRAMGGAVSSPPAWGGKAERRRSKRLLKNTPSSKEVQDSGRLSRAYGERVDVWGVRMGGVEKVLGKQQDVLEAARRAVAHLTEELAPRYEKMFRDGMRRSRRWRCDQEPEPFLRGGRGVAVWNAATMAKIPQ